MLVITAIRILARCETFHKWQENLKKNTVNICINQQFGKIFTEHLASEAHWSLQLSPLRLHCQHCDRMERCSYYPGHLTLPQCMALGLSMSQVWAEMHLCPSKGQWALLSYFKRQSSFSIPHSLQWPERRSAEQSSPFNQEEMSSKLLRLPVTRRREQNWDPLPCSWTKVPSFWQLISLLWSSMST